MIIKNKKKIFSFSLILFLGVGLFLLAPTAHAADPADWAGKVIGGLIGMIIGALGIILALVMEALVAVAQYSNFINSPVISYGWAMVRDICNMFFVLILLVIAFATILKIESYSYKKMLPKLILMAVLINFSKTICGLLIDFAQVVMLTFVNAFKDIAAGNLITNLGITEILTLANSSDDLGFWAIVGAYVLGLIYILIALVVIVTMLAMLVMRIVMIWIYVVLSPAAYLLSAAGPSGQGYAKQWWTEFTKNLIVGPVLAFFIWLSFVSLQAPSFSSDFKGSGQSTQQVAGSVGIQSSEPMAATEASTPDVFIKFVIAIGLLIGGLKISQEIGGAAGGMAGKGMSKITKGAAIASGVGIGALALAKRGAKNAGMAAVSNKKVRGALDTIGSQRGGWGQALRFTGVRSLARAGSLSLGKHKLEVEEKAKKRVEAFKKAGATETIASIASGKAFTMSQKAAKETARSMAIVPEEHFDKTRGTVGLVDANHKREAEQRLNEQDFDSKTPSIAQVMQLGKSGINLANTPQFRALLEKNSKLAGAYNSGQEDAGLTDYVNMTNREGNPIMGAGRYGTMINVPSQRDRLIGRTGNNKYALKTVREEDEEGEEENGQNDRLEEEQSVPADTPEVLRQRATIKGITKTEDPELIEETRKKLAEWSAIEGNDNFRDNTKVGLAFQQAETENKQRKEVAQQKEKIASITGSTDEDLIEKTRKKINTWSAQDGENYYQNKAQVELAFAHAQEERRPEDERAEQEKKRQETEAVKQKSRISEVVGTDDEDLLERTRLKIHDRNIETGEDNFQSDYEIHQAFGQAKDEKEIDQHNANIEQEKAKTEQERAQWKASEKKKKQEAGPGTLAGVNAFGRGSSNFIAADFTKLDPAIQEKLKSDSGRLNNGNELELKEIQGANIDDSADIKKIAKSIIGIINDEINTIKSKPAITKNDENRLKNLEATKVRLKDPKAIKNLQLANSSSLGYSSYGVRKDTLIHESLHGHGISGTVVGERMVEGITKEIADKPAERAAVLSGGEKFDKYLEKQMRIHRGSMDSKGQPKKNSEKSKPKKSVQDVIAAENTGAPSGQPSAHTDAAQAHNSETPASGSHAVTHEENITNTTNITNITNKEEKEKIKKSLLSKPTSDPLLSSYLARIGAGLNKIGLSLGKKEKPVTPKAAPAAADHAPSPAATPIENKDIEININEPYENEPDDRVML